MATYGGKDYTGFNNVNLKGGSIRNAQEDTYVANLPLKAGTFGITGTFTVNLGSIAANAIASTNVVVSGIRVDDGIVATIQNGTTTALTNRGFAILNQARAANGGMELVFVNPTASATVYADVVVAYTAVR